MALNTAIKRAIEDHTGYKAVKVTDVSIIDSVYKPQDKIFLSIDVEVIKKPKTKKK